MKLETLKQANDLKFDIIEMEQFLQDISKYRKAIEAAGSFDGLLNVEITIQGSGPRPHFTPFYLKIPRDFVAEFLSTLQISYFENSAQFFLKRAKDHLDSL